MSLQLGVCREVCSMVSDFATPWTAAHQAPLSMGFLGKNTGIGYHFLLQGIFPAEGLNPHLLHWPIALCHLGSLIPLYTLFILKNCVDDGQIIIMVTLIAV